MAQTGSPMGIEALELFLSGRTETGAVPGLSVSAVKGEEGLEASEILTETVRENSPRLSPWWKSKCRRTRKSICVYANFGHQTLYPSTPA